MKIQVEGAVRVDVSKFLQPAIAPGDGVPELQLLVGGKWRGAAKGEVFDDRSPIDGPSKEAERWTVGDPRAEATKVGPLVNEKAAANVHGLVEDAVSAAARRR